MKKQIDTMDEKGLLKLILSGIIDLSLKVQEQNDLLKKHLGIEFNNDDRLRLRDTIREIIQRKGQVTDEFDDILNE